ncbi:hypothetical protein M231_03252 [Tremella mesenterica]|uniref:Protein ZIP4 homolog n=1 Tax=Tremella mesenterica TaxID=5217 RepID=A0A4Q1BNH7_TREME|nr:hypothetical protein M231_03252 [Tremella mesenterica]
MYYSQRSLPPSYQVQTQSNDLRLVLGGLMESTLWTQEGVAEIIHEINSLATYPDLPIRAFQEFLLLALSLPEAHDCVVTVMLAILMYAKGISETRALVALKMVEEALDALASGGDYTIESKTEVAAYSTLLWSLGDKLAAQRAQSQSAAAWFQLAAHPALTQLELDGSARCWRKAALCYIRAGDNSSARALLERCSPAEASTQYLSFLVALQQGDDTTAIQAVKSIVSCPDLDGRQVVLMASAEDPGAHNVAKHYCTTSALLMVDYRRLMSDKVDATFCLQMAQVMYACFCGKVFLYRDMSPGSSKAELLEQLLAYLPHCHASIADLNSEPTTADVKREMMKMLDITSVELFCEAQDWDGLRMIVETIIAKQKKEQTDMEEVRSTSTLEAIQDVLAGYPACPTRLTFSVLEAILETFVIALDSDVAPFSRWTRSGLTVLLNRGEKGDDKKAAEVVMKALKVMSSSIGVDSYPEDEKEWLFAQVWNKGLDFHGKGQIALAKWWTDMGLALAKHVPLEEGRMEQKADGSLGTFKEYQQGFGSVSRSLISYDPVR